MAGLVPAIHVFLIRRSKAWMLGISTGMTIERPWPPNKIQNKKYLCAIGSVSAGAQVSSSPSARTS
jgi:hypothetical protein